MKEDHLKRYIDLKTKWDQIEIGMSVEQAETIMGFSFSLDSHNRAGRMVFSHHTTDYLPFYLVVNAATGLIERRHDIKALNYAVQHVLQIDRPAADELAVKTNKVRDAYLT